MPRTLGLIAPADSGSDPAVTAKNLELIKQFATDVLDQNSQSMRMVVAGTKRTFTTVYWMYVALFAVGIGAAVAAIVRSFTSTTISSAVMSLGFAGLTAASFYAVFLLRPLDAMGRAGIFLSWLVAVTNTYWTRLMYLDDAATMDADLKLATADLVQELSALADKYAASLGNAQPVNAPTGSAQPVSAQPVPLAGSGQPAGTPAGTAGRPQGTAQ